MGFAATDVLLLKMGPVCAYFRTADFLDQAYTFGVVIFHLYGRCACALFDRYNSELRSPVSSLFSIRSRSFRITCHFFIFYTWFGKVLSKRRQYILKMKNCRRVIHGQYKAPCWTSMKEF